MVPHGGDDARSTDARNHGSGRDEQVNALTCAVGHPATAYDRHVAEGARRPTMARIAADLGVSVSTVSNAYRRPEKLSEEVRARVLAHALAIGYPGPEPLPRGPHRRGAGAVGLVFTDELAFAFRDPASSGFFAGLSEELAPHDLNVVLVPAGEPVRRRRAPLDRVAVDGIVVHSVPDDDESLALVLRRGGPAVVVDQPGADRRADWVGLNERTAMRELGAHLASLGHRHVGVVTSRLMTSPHDGPVDARRWRRSRYAIPRQRLTGLEEGLGAEVRVVERWRVSAQDGAEAAAALLRGDPRTTAVVCLADSFAQGVLSWAGARGVPVPEALSVTGFDDVAGSAALGLTTIAQPLTLKGRRAGGLLLEQLGLSGPARPAGRVSVLPTRLRVRGTTGPAGGPARP